MTVDARAAEPLEAMPVQLPAQAAGAAEARARYFNSGNAFNVAVPGVPAATFRTEADRARAAGTGLVACDQSGALDLGFAATTPLMLARYAALASRATLAAAFVATGAIWYVIAGGGEAGVAGESFAWGAGDVFVTPGGVDVKLGAGDGGALLWVVTNEPQPAFEGVVPSAAQAGAAPPVQYPAAEIARQLARVVAAPRASTTSGCALIFSSQRAQASRNVLPTLTLSLNTLPPRERQRTHKHNAAAITLVVAGRACYTLVDGARTDWSPHATLVTPRGAAHSHYNDGDERAVFLIVQDGGPHYHARTMGFAFLAAESPEA